MKRVRYRLYEMMDEVVDTVSAETGKPSTEALTHDVMPTLLLLLYLERVAPKTLKPERIFTVLGPALAGSRARIEWRPFGVVGCITPWNYPILNTFLAIAPPLFAGNAVVVKPSEVTPQCGELVRRILEPLPSGVANVIQGAAEVGAALVDAPCDKIALIGSPVTGRKISFTGSTEVGKILMAQCAGTVKKLSLELGGNAPFIVFEDADLDAAVEGAIVSKYRNTGQTCVCANRFLVQDSVYDEFARRLGDAVSGLKVGSGLEDGITQGPLIDMAAVAKVESHISDAVAKGARIAQGGSRHEAGGRFFTPTVLTDVTPDMAVAREETFGPVAPLFRFDSEADAIRLANATEFGLAAYFYGRDVGRVWRVAEALEYGIVGVNTGLISTELAPFGGMKESGIGREGSKYGLEEFLEVKYICLGGI